MLILEISIFWFNSLGIQFWNFRLIFEIAWVALLCVGVCLLKLSGASFGSIWKACRMMSNYLNAHAKVKKWIFNIEFPWNWFEFDIISNDFWSSIIWAISIQVSLTEFKNPKIPGIQPSHCDLGLSNKQIKFFEKIVKLVKYCVLVRHISWHVYSILKSRKNIQILNYKSSVENFEISTRNFFDARMK